MTIKEFERHKFAANNLIKYKDETYKIAAVDFEERLICILDDEENLLWVRFENCDFVTND